MSHGEFRLILEFCLHFFQIAMLRFLNNTVFHGVSRLANTESRARICKRLRNRFRQAGNLFLGSLKGYKFRTRICKRSRRSGIDSEDSIPPAYVAWRAGTTNRVVVPARQAGNRFLGSFKGLQIRAIPAKMDGGYSIKIVNIFAKSVKEWKHIRIFCTNGPLRS